MESIVKTAGNSGSIVVNIHGEVPKGLKHEVSSLPPDSEPKRLRTSPQKSMRNCREWLRKGTCPRERGTCRFQHPEHSKLKCKWGIKCRKSACLFGHPETTSGKTQTPGTGTTSGKTQTPWTVTTSGKTQTPGKTPVTPDTAEK